MKLEFSANSSYLPSILTNTSQPSAFVFHFYGCDYSRHRLHMRYQLGNTERFLKVMAHESNGAKCVEMTKLIGMDKVKKKSREKIRRY